MPGIERTGSRDTFDLCDNEAFAVLGCRGQSQVVES